MESNKNLSQIVISPSLEDVLRIAVVSIGSLSIGQNDRKLHQAIESLGEELRRSIGDRPPSELERVVRTRRLFKSMGIDATKDRPSSERLLRRVLAGERFPVVNDLVDAMNLVSLKLQFPLGLYDWDSLVPPVLIRVGRPDESFRGTAGYEIGLQGKIILVDGEGPFGGPTGDSARTAIERRTVRCLVVAFAPADTPRSALEEAIREIDAAAGEYCGGRVAASGILP
jgi:DNA/RNA-binding domain of Phe-tRNA-synthetase-like protein